MSLVNKVRLLHQVRKNQWLKHSELLELQNKKLRAIVKHAYNNTEFYHKKFREAGIDPDCIKTVEDLEKIPFTTKEEVREHSLKAMIAKGVNLNKCIIDETSGSTGAPLKFVYDERADDFSKAVNLRSHIENGLRFTDKWAVFSDPRHIHEQRWFQKLGVLNPKFISATDSAENQLPAIRRINPDVLGGYSSSIRLLAKKIEECGITDVNPRVVFGTSELLDPDTRKYINSVFDVEMVDLFGCLELNRTAWECSEHVGYHIDIDAIVMELVSDDINVADGERGEVVYTGLYNYAMPLIRYKIGDVATKTDEMCPCGRGLPLLKSVEGRKGDFFKNPDGRIFSSMIWYNMMRRIPGIEKYKVIQERVDTIRILVVKGSDFSQNTLDIIENYVMEDMGEKMSTIIEIVDDIPKDRSGKLRYVVSNLK